MRFPFWKYIKIHYSYHHLLPATKWEFVQNSSSCSSLICSLHFLLFFLLSQYSCLLMLFGLVRKTVQCFWCTGEFGWSCTASCSKPEAYFGIKWILSSPASCCRRTCSASGPKQSNRGCIVANTCWRKSWNSLCRSTCRWCAGCDWWWWSRYALHGKIISDLNYTNSVSGLFLNNVHTNSAVFEIRSIFLSLWCALIFLYSNQNVLGHLSWQAYASISFACL